MSTLFAFPPPSLHIFQSLPRGWLGVSRLLYLDALAEFCLTPPSAAGPTLTSGSLAGWQKGRRSVLPQCLLDSSQINIRHELGSCVWATLWEQLTIVSTHKRGKDFLLSSSFPLPSQRTHLPGLKFLVSWVGVFNISQRRFRARKGKV